MTKTAKENAAATVELSADKPRVKPLDPRRLLSPGFGWRSWETTIPADTAPHTLLEGKFWRLCAPRVQRGDRIQWRGDDLKAFGELVVVAHDIATGDLEVREIWSKQIRDLVASVTVTPAEKGTPPRVDVQGRLEALIGMEG